MNKKIKIIDLVLKIANGQELPKKIKVRNYIFEWVDIDTGKGYHNTQGKDWIIWLQDLISLDTKEELNETVEILEDNTEEIEELFDYRTGENDLYNDNFDDMFRKINELVKAVNEIRKDMNKEQCCCCGAEITDENRALHNMCKECKYGIDWEEKTK